MLAEQFRAESRFLSVRHATLAEHGRAIFVGHNGIPFLAKLPNGLAESELAEHGNLPLHVRQDCRFRVAPYCASREYTICRQALLVNSFVKYFLKYFLCNKFQLVIDMISPPMRHAGGRAFFGSSEYWTIFEKWWLQ